MMTTTTMMMVSFDFLLILYFIRLTLMQDILCTSFSPSQMMMKTTMMKKSKYLFGDEQWGKIRLKKCEM